jgi:hypothetical protein
MTRGCGRHARGGVAVQVRGSGKLQTTRAPGSAQPSGTCSDATRSCEALSPDRLLNVPLDFVSRNRSISNLHGDGRLARSRVYRRAHTACLCDRPASSHFYLRPHQRLRRWPYFLQKVGVPVYPEQVSEQLTAKHRAMAVQSTSTTTQLDAGAVAPRKSRTGTGRRVTLRPVVFGICSRRAPSESAANPAVHHQVHALHVN